MKKPIILFRKGLTSNEEIESAKKAGFDISFSRMPLQDNLVIGRYSVLPLFKELEEDLKYNNSELINNHFMHDYIASFDYYQDISKYTFPTWFTLQDIPENEAPFVVKGQTNSKKHEWKTKMFAQTKKDAINISLDLKNDSLFYDQDIVIRKFIELESVDIGINGMNFANEWRLFFYKDKLLAKGFYWVTTDLRGTLEQAGLDMAQEVANIVKDRVNFFVIDIAKTKSGKWIVVELNDGQQSGLSDVNPDELYTNLKKYINEEL